ncbi:phosphatase PAP2 family protein [Demequina sp. TTPB684]|uniref:phosphatase PAP2 family protein n=1 Tax=unclassified Demequina TaxID=2620311 RepID=UPI001CF40AB2|nr:MULTISPECIES: phosphatase PAP2 family protein [unclassified Demequina]MCB2413971.1 phosphatase PAP2 family protein [Demequina sp. TTPB684]UPU88675.1 phosphatase PAP2 family protein [Demequina sp. TMPB413]
MSHDANRPAFEPQRSSDDLSDLTLSTDGTAGAARPGWWRRHRPWMTEIGLIIGLYYLYSVMRSASPDRVSLAMNNADLVERVQRAAGLDMELALNQMFVRNQWLADFASLWYQITHMVVTAGILLWLWHRRRENYGALRTSLAVLMVAGLATYWLFPLAPPRFALNGAVDTMHANPVLFAGQESVTGLANLYAAMPSLHVGWAVWCALAVVMTTKSRWWYAAWLYPLTTTFVVMGTANHYLLDAAAGTVYAVGAYAVVRSAYARVVATPAPAQAGV